MLLKRITINILTILAILIACPSAWAATYYVNGSNGNDSNQGTLDNPWKTIGKANSTLQAGDTVYIRKGTYNQTIRPSKSGTQGNYITYARYDNEEVIITGVTDGADLRARNYIAIDGLSIIKPSNFGVNIQNNSGSYHHIIVKNCYLYGANGWTNLYMKRVSYSKILNNTFESYCNNGSGGPTGDHTSVRDGSSYNLFEGNYYGESAHTSLAFEDKTSDQTAPLSYNVIRDNIFSNPLHSNVSLWDGTRYHLFDNNSVLDAGENAANNMCGSSADRTKPRVNHTGFKSQSKSSIIRRNLFVNNGKVSIVAWKSDNNETHDNRVYNNTISENVDGLQVLGDSIVNGNVIKNNIIYNNKGFNINRSLSTSPRENYYFNNNILNGSIKYAPEAGTTSLDNLNTKYASYWKANIASFPEFVDESNRDYNLQSTSPMIDKGDFLTRTTSAGSGKIIPVRDATYFMDGWGIIEGDLIQLEKQDQPVRILNIENNNITVDRNISWNNGDGVSLPYTGSAPDIGAFENAAATKPAPASPTNLRIESQQ